MNKRISQPEIHTLAVNERQVPVRIHYETRGNSRVSITRRGVIIRISRFLSINDKSQQILEFKDWALKKLIQRPELIKPKRKEYYSGKIIAVRDKTFLLHLEFVDTKTNTAQIKDGILSLKLSTLQSEAHMEKAISQLVSRCIARAMHSWVFERLSYLNKLHFSNKKFKTLRLKYTSSLWGSCSHEGNISISTRLLLTPDSVIDYVLVHELAHLLVPNHSRKFWEVVAKVFPDYEISEKWLKENGKFCDF